MKDAPDLTGISPSVAQKWLTAYDQLKKNPTVGPEWLTRRQLCLLFNVEEGELTRRLKALRESFTIERKRLNIDGHSTVHFHLVPKRKKLAK